MSKAARGGIPGCDADIAALYFKTAAYQLPEMSAALRSKAWPQIQRLAHKLAGASAFLGLRTMAKASNALEQAAERKKLKEAENLLRLLKKEFTQMRRQKIPGVPQAAPQPAPQRSVKRKFKIFIVDDHPLIREGLLGLIGLQSDLHLCGQTATTDQALKAIPRLKPDLVILDITLADSNGMGLIKDMKLRSLKSLILVLSMHEEVLYAERALRAGAQGYIMKREGPKEILKAIHHILDGEIYLSEKMSAKMLHKVADGGQETQPLPESSLSDRELQTFQLIGQGRGTRDIAEELHISPKTVESYRAHIKNKMNLKNARELTLNAVHWVEHNHLN